ncbi:hypothetical protein DFH08DRAFT_271690 [Mycena albidolilacea]|uniref:Uncharacterized protein n=1 Tax=Mycena albidolilacea TaxID=1033008 RepID=A0AAD7F454_9AGAR|nr:hypothetical protein DFH08DRAFT_271690 [Mycena albidolilacea]
MNKPVFPFGLLTCTDCSATLSGRASWQVVFLLQSSFNCSNRASVRPGDIIRIHRRAFGMSERHRNDCQDNPAHKHLCVHKSRKQCRNTVGTGRPGFFLSLFRFDVSQKGRESVCRGVGIYLWLVGNDSSVQLIHFLKLRKLLCTNCDFNATAGSIAQRPSGQWSGASGKREIKVVVSRPDMGFGDARTPSQANGSKIFEFQTTDSDSSARLI